MRGGEGRWLAGRDNELCLGDDELLWAEHSRLHFGITRRQRQHFMWKPTVPVTSLLSVKMRKGNNVSTTLLVAVFLPEWRRLAQMTLGSQGDRPWQHLLWIIHGPERIRIKSWHRDHFSASIPLRALGEGAFQTPCGWRVVQEWWQPFWTVL